MPAWPTVISRSWIVPQLSVQDGERIGLIGRNGTGKSTLLRVVSGLAGLDDGAIERRDGLRIAFVEQEPQLPAPPAEHDWKLAMYLERFAVDLERAAATGSGGVRKRVALARRSRPSPTCCCWTSPPTTWTSTPSSPAGPAAGHRHGADRHPRPRVPGRGRDPHRRAGPRHAALAIRAISRAYQVTKEQELASEALATRASTSSWRRRRSGSARAWRRAAPATRAACVRLEQLRRERAARRERIGHVRSAGRRRRSARARWSPSSRTSPCASASAR